MLEITFRDRDNSISLRLRASTVNEPILQIVDLSDITRMLLIRDDGFVVDSAKTPNIFDWLTLATDGIVNIQLGHLNLKVGKDKWRLVVFDATNTNGITWGNESFYIDLKQEYADN